MCKKSDNCSNLGMEICMFCGEPKNITISKHLKNNIPMNFIANSIPCDKCVENISSGFTFFIITKEEPSDENLANIARIDSEIGDVYLVGQYFVVKPEALPEEIRNTPSGKMLITKEEAVEIGLMEEEEK